MVNQGKTSGEATVMAKIMLVALAISLALGVAAPVAALEPVVNPVALGDFRLSLIGNEQHQVYLGIASQPTLSVSEIHADRLIIVIFNTFCTICQSDAEILNLAYGLVEQEPDLKGRIKIVGIAAGNTQTEVEQFRQSHRVPFPLFADPDFKVDQAVPQNLRTPMMVSVKNPGGEQLRVVKMHMGAVKSVEDVLDEGLKRSAALDVRLSSN